MLITPAERHLDEERENEHCFVPPFLSIVIHGELKSATKQVGDQGRCEMSRNCLCGGLKA